jgi:thiamine-phosphate pyrophosphorylase
MMGLKHQAASARKWRSAARQVTRHFPAHLPPLLFMTDPKRTPDPISVITTLPPEAGVVYRHFGATDRYATARELAEVCAQRGVSFLIAADPELALKTGADGVHWPEAMRRRALKWQGQFALQTGSAHSPAAIRAAHQAGLDAVLVSTVFASNSPSASEPLGLARFRSWAKAAPLPVYGLGGVTSDNAGSLADIAGLAAIDGFLL